AAAPINQGTSGGPTFSTNGEVIGITTAISSPNGGGSVGIGFAIPSNLAKPVIAALRDKGGIERGWLGVQIQAVTPEIASATGLDRDEGAIVAAVQPKSPAEKAGLKSGDVILAFDGKDVPHMHDLPRMVAAAPVGENAELTIWRDHAKRTVSVTIAKLAEDNVASNDNNSQQPAEPNASPVDSLGLNL